MFIFQDNVCFVIVGEYKEEKLLPKFGSVFQVFQVFDKRNTKIRENKKEKLVIIISFFDINSG